MKLNLNSSKSKIYPKPNKNTVKEPVLELRFHEKIIPISCFCNQNKKKKFNKDLEIIYEYLTLNNMLKQSQEIEGLKRCLLTSNELVIFESFFNKTFFIEKDKKKSTIENEKNIKERVQSFFNKMKQNDFPGSLTNLNKY